MPSIMRRPRPRAPAGGRVRSRRVAAFKAVAFDLPTPRDGCGRGARRGGRERGLFEAFGSLVASVKTRHAHTEWCGGRSNSVSMCMHTALPPPPFSAVNSARAVDRTVGHHPIPSRQRARTPYITSESGKDVQELKVT